MLAHFPGNCSEHSVPVLEFNPELGVGQGFHYGTLYLNNAIFSHVYLCPIVHLLAANKACLLVVLFFLSLLCWEAITQRAMLP